MKGSEGEGLSVKEEELGRVRVNSMNSEESNPTEKYRKVLIISFSRRSQDKLKLENVNIRESPQSVSLHTITFTMERDTIPGLGGIPGLGR